MNKNDRYLIIGSILLSFIIMFFFSELFSKNGKTATIYYQNEKVKTIDLMQDAVYEIEGDKGAVILEVKNGKIRVKEENSPLHICSKQGYIQKSTESIICLPNKIVIQIEAKNDIDAVVR